MDDHRSLQQATAAAFMERAVTSGYDLVRPRTWTWFESAPDKADTVAPLDIPLQHQTTPHKTIPMSTAHNVLGTPLETCSLNPRTGFYRDGCCNTGADDAGLHLVCIIATDAFLEFSAAVGNDLSTPIPAYGFPGLKAGDRWCLCVQRWQQALQAGTAPQVVLEATHISALEFVDLEDLQKYAITP